MKALVAGLLLLGLLVPQTGTLTFTAPDSWKPRPACSAMRVAAFVVPKLSSDSEHAEVVVYFFAGGGGSVDANIQRWVGQFQQPDGAAAKASGRSTFEVGNLKVTNIDVSGTYVAEVRPGATERLNKPNFSMRAAVVETPKGLYFVKFTGPAATVTAGSPAFDQFLKTLRF
ncbi:MAG: hypothetical protein M3541_05040 [Acidobacteriota bacterium]|nr:hypothetical protein [Acidobacteriota bacterium]MDQ3418134.1 hypothetical protein [Acidobacteriota bacterium]